MISVMKTKQQLCHYSNEQISFLPNLLYITHTVWVQLVVTPPQRQWFIFDDIFHIHICIYTSVYIAYFLGFPLNCLWSTVHVVRV